MQGLLWLVKMNNYLILFTNEIFALIGQYWQTLIVNKLQILLDTLKIDTVTIQFLQWCLHPSNMPIITCYACLHYMNMKAAFTWQSLQSAFRQSDSTMYCFASEEKVAFMSVNSEHYLSNALQHIITRPKILAVCQNSITCMYRIGDNVPGLHPV